MNSNIIKCSKCSQIFNENDRIPINLKCGDTLCKKCIEEMIHDKVTKCPICSKELKLSKKKLENLPHNKQILLALKENKIEEFSKIDEDLSENILEQSSVISSSKVIDKCSKHADKIIEYFCKDCTMVVCVVCIYSNHNGHNLSILDEMGSIIKQNINDFSKMLKNVGKINDENLICVKVKYNEIKELKEQQIKIVEKSFEEIRVKLEEKKDEITKTFYK